MPLLLGRLGGVPWTGWKRLQSATNLPCVPLSNARGLPWASERVCDMPVGVLNGVFSVCLCWASPISPFPLHSASVHHLFCPSWLFQSSAIYVKPQAMRPFYVRQPPFSASRAYPGLDPVPRVPAGRIQSTRPLNSHRVRTILRRASHLSFRICSGAASVLACIGSSCSSP